MKKILSFLLFVPLLFACYQDLGNYDYKLDSMNEITSATFTPSVANDIFHNPPAFAPRYSTFPGKDR